jgi:hypothetical protein
LRHEGFSGHNPETDQVLCLTLPAPPLTGKTRCPYNRPAPKAWVVVNDEGPASKERARGEERNMGKLSLLREFWLFLRVRKKWWLGPIVLVLVFLAFLIIFTEGSAVAPFIYALF